MVDARKAWKQAYREIRLIGRANGCDQRAFGCIMHACGARSVWDGRAGHMAARFQSLLQNNERAGRQNDRYERTRTILNSFGRLNPWKCFTPSPAKYRDSQRVRALRAKLLERRLIAPEPGGYVTGLLSHAPAKMWWVDYPSPVAAMGRDDVEIYEGRKLAA